RDKKQAPNNARKRLAAIRPIVENFMETLLCMWCPAKFRNANRNQYVCHDRLFFHIFAIPSPRVPAQSKDCSLQLVFSFGRHAASCRDSCSDRRRKPKTSKSRR